MMHLMLRRALVFGVIAAKGGGRGATAEPHVRLTSETVDECPRCDMIFTMLETVSSGERVQHIEMQERGEPKSGTTFMYHWAHGALVHTCNFLNRWFGSGSCIADAGRIRGLFHTPEDVRLTFDPRLGGKGAECSCDYVDRVEIHVTDSEKHRLPVDAGCKWQHAHGFAKGGVDCDAADGKPADSLNDIWLCMEEEKCAITDDRRQFVIMRDPRAEAVSTFFHQQLHPTSSPHRSADVGIDTLDEYVLEMVPVLCQWIALRYFLFAAILEPQSTLFWYRDAFLDAHRWHYDWLASVGLHLPEPVVDAMADAALREDFDFETAGRNDHPGVNATHGGEAAERPTWHDMLRPETIEALDVIVRKWLPPEFLVKLNISTYRRGDT